MQPADQTHHVSLEFTLGSDAMRGTIEQRDGTRERFWGWLALMAALERIGDRTSETDDRSP